MAQAVPVITPRTPASMELGRSSTGQGHYRAVSLPRRRVQPLDVSSPRLPVTRRVPLDARPGHPLSITVAGAHGFVLDHPLSEPSVRLSSDKRRGPCRGPTERAHFGWRRAGPSVWTRSVPRSAPRFGRSSVDRPGARALSGLRRGEALERPAVLLGDRERFTVEAIALDEPRPRHEVLGRVEGMSPGLCCYARSGDRVDHRRGRSVEPRDPSRAHMAPRSRRPRAARLSRGMGRWTQPPLVAQGPRCQLSTTSTPRF
jgi:hypothetical protein